MGIFDTLTDPGTDALLGLAAGFGQASMPTRMPTSIGGVIGQGITGMQQGLATGQALRKGDIQNQQAKIGLDWYKNMMNQQGQSGGSGASAPFGAPNVDANGQYIVSPNMLASMAMAAIGQGKDPTGPLKLLESYATSGVAMGPRGNAISVPGANNATLAHNYAASTGTKLGEAPFMAGVTMDTPVLDTNGRPTLDAQGQPITRKQTMTIPQQNAYLTGQPTQGATPANADPFPGWAHQINHGENGTGNPAAPNASGPGGTATSSAMGNGQFLAGTWPSVIRAVRPDLAAGKTDAQLLPLRAVPELAQSATEQYARQNGATLAQAGLPVTGGTVALAHFLGPQGAATVLNARPDAPLSMLPGMGATVAANPSLKGMTAGQLAQKYQTQMGAAPTAQVAGPGAPVQIPPVTPQSAPMPQAPGVGGPQALTPKQDADLKVSTANRMPGDLRVGGERVTYDENGAPVSIIKNPEHFVVQNPDGTSTLGHLEPAPPNAAPGTPGTFVPVAQLDKSGRPVQGDVGKGVPPDVQQGRTELVKEFFGKDTDSYVAAKNTHAWLNQIDQAADAMNSAGGVYNTGPFAAARVGMMQKINDIGRTVGLGAAFDEKTLTAPEELRKATTTAGFELSSHYEGHARQAASTIENATSAVPGMANSPQGVKLVSAGIREGAQSAIDSHEYRQARFQGQDPYGLNPQANGQRAGAGLETAETDFYKKFTPEMYSTRAISTVHPVVMTAKGLDDFNTQAQKYLPGTQIILNGQPKVIPPRADAPPVPGYLQNRIQAPPNGG